MKEILQSYVLTLESESAMHMQPGLRTKPFHPDIRLTECEPLAQKVNKGVMALEKPDTWHHIIT